MRANAAGFGLKYREMLKRMFRSVSNGLVERKVTEAKQFLMFVHKKRMTENFV